ncbi:hypothetical protein R1flu_009045 [Riccia fluitans]|uniref:Uncharacterized protein n=1 Tax=Riccia fluitans TaxID=41844 RepID=A0ABD1Z0Z0_9MARC
MERNRPIVYSTVIYGSGFPLSTAVKGVKVMDQQEPKEVAAEAVPGFVTDHKNNNRNNKANYEARPQTEVGSSLPPASALRKRKEYSEMDASEVDTMMYHRKRIRHNSTASRVKDSFKPQQQQRGGFEFMAGVEIGASKRMITPPRSSGRPRGPFHFYEGMLKSERVLPKPGCGAATTSVASSGERILKPACGFRPSETSKASCDLTCDDKKSGGNTSSLTSHEDEDCRTMSTFAQVLEVVSNRFGMYTAVPAKKDTTGAVRQDISGAHVQLLSSDQPSSKWKQQHQHIRKSVDDEVISVQRKKSSYSSRESELNRVFGVGVWDTHEKSAATASGLAISGCSSAGNDSTSSRDINGTKEQLLDVRSTKLKQLRQPSGKYKTGLSNSSREHQSRSSVTTDLCASSDSVSLCDRLKTSVFSHLTSSGKLDDEGTAAAAAASEGPLDHHHLTSVQEEKYTNSRSQYTTNSSKSEGVGIHPIPVSLEREVLKTAIRSVSMFRDDSSSGSGSGGSDSGRPQPTFVLSSGRMSKTQEAQLGKRPTTIDDDFDEYFAQLML